jgi:hypothetical protein
MLNGKLGVGFATRWQALMVVGAATFAMLWASAARATITQGDFSVFGFLESREEGRWGEGSSTENGTLTRVTHIGPFPETVPGRASTETGGSFDFNHWDLDEMRQLADIRPDYHIVKNYKLLGRLDTIVLKDADAFAFYRPWYDAIGTLKNKGTGEPNRDLSPYDHATLQQQYFKNDLHEYYGQLNFTDNFSARIGKQEVIWSEADALSGTEVTNTVDATYHGIYGAESPEDVRKNLRMVKLNYILPDYLKTANNELEGFWIPGDYQGNGITVATDPRNPWAVVVPITLPGGEAFNQNGQPFRVQTVHDEGARQMLFLAPTIGFADLYLPTVGRTPSNSIENSEFGARYSTLIPLGNGLQTSLIYLFEARDDKTNTCTNCTAAQALESLGSAAKGLPIGAISRSAPGTFLASGFYRYGFPRPGVMKAGTLIIMSDVDYRRNNFFGITGTYYDKDLTDIVYRYDGLYEPKFPVSDPHRSSGSSDTERVRLIVAGDRPTYIPWLSKQHTFITVQYTNTWYPDRPPGATAAVTATGKVRETQNFAFIAFTNWLMNGQLTATNVFEADLDDNTQAVSSSNVYRYSRNVLFGANAIWFLGRSGRFTDPFLLSRSQRQNLLEFTLTYEI